MIEMIFYGDASHHKLFTIMLFTHEKCVNNMSLIDATK